MANAGLFEWMRRQALGAAVSEPRYYVGLDLGQSRDPTAIAVVRRIEPAPPPPKGRPEPAYAEGSVEWALQQELNGPYNKKRSFESRRPTSRQRHEQGLRPPLSSLMRRASRSG
jgi:hypothetical protein